MSNARRGVRWFALAATIAAVVVTVPSALADEPAVETKASNVVPGGYVVQLTEKPVVTYEGGIPGLQATKPGKGEKIDPQSAKVKNYVSHLNSRHNAVLGQVGGGEKFYDYVYAYNGFAAKLSAAQAEKVERLSGVKSVEPIMQWAPDTSDTPDFLNIDGPGELWSQLGGPGGPNEGAGEDLVLGSIDTGIWPEHPSVDDRVAGKKVYQNLPGWHGHCTSAEQAPGGSWDANLCNQKLIGAQYFIETAEAFDFPLAPNEFRSPRDSDGHGTHTATTAAGNNNIAPTGAAAGFGPISGMAPRARISTYKVCWDDGDINTGGCFTTDSAAAIDQAVADGVDAINFSISGTTNSFLNVVEVAAFNAASAGVFVAMSAGNTGPPSTVVAHPSPWLTTVGASTHDRASLGKVTLGAPSGATFFGLSQTTTTVTDDVVLSENVKLPSATVADAQLCFLGTLDPALVNGKIVVCDRGVNARVEKSREVFQRGGVGMILLNPTANSLNADLHFVPSVHLQNTDRAAVRTYVSTAPTPTATIAKDTTSTWLSPEMAAFSSRGPSAATGDQLKPDITAPGVDVLAGYSPASIVVPGRSFEIVSGTSMSSPHIAGIGLLIKDAHPGWTPAMIKSALMTTAENVVGTFTGDAAASADARRAFAQGAGHVDPTPAANPGLVYNNGPVDWLRFICGTGQLPASDCAPFGGPIDPSDLNLASIAIGDLAGTQTVDRTVTSVASGSETYAVSFQGLPGITASASPNSFTIGAGGTQNLDITFTRAGAALNTYQAGFMTLTSPNHVVRSPIVIRPVALAAPLEVTLNSSNAASYSIKSGVGPENITLGKRGLLAASTDAVTLSDDADNTFDTANPDSNPAASTFKKSVVVPAGQAVLRFSTHDVDTDGNDDLDIYLYRGTTLIAISAGPTAEEVVTVRNPTAATYHAYVHAFEADGGSVNFTLFNWLLAPVDALNMTVNGPFAATIGSTHTVNVTTTGLTAGTRYLGQVTYTGSVSGPIGTPTIVSGKAS